jgi:hypothetical protein
MTVSKSIPRAAEPLANALRSRVDGEIRFDSGSRAAYSRDASNFRQVPIGVVVPRDVEAGMATVAVCHGRTVFDGALNRRRTACSAPTPPIPATG